MKLFKTILTLTIATNSLYADWDLPAEDISDAGQNASLPQVAVDPSGNAVAVWKRSNGANDIIQAATWNGSSWSTAEDLSDTGFDAERPQVSVDSSGNAMAVWERFDGIGTQIQASFFDGSDWDSTPANLTSGAGLNLTPQVGINSSTRAVAVYQNGTSILANEWDSPNWSSGSSLGSGIGPQVGTDSSDNAVAVSQFFDGSNNIIRASFFNGLVWDSIPTSISPSGSDAERAQVAMNPAGSAVAVWSRNDGLGNNIIESSFFDGAVWISTPILVSELTGNFFFPQVAVDSSGNAVAVWESDEGANNIIQAAFWDGADWSTPLEVSSSEGVFSAPQVGLDSEGNAVAVWQGSDGGNTVIQASFWDGSAWTTPENISELEQDASLPQVGTGSSENAVAVWQRSNGSNTIIQAAAANGFTPPPPPTPPTPPSGFSGVVEKNVFLTETDIINSLTWIPSTDINVVGYRIYQEGKVVAEVSFLGPFEVSLHNRVKGSANVYSLVGFTILNEETEPLTLTIQ